MIDPRLARLDALWGDLAGVLRSPPDASAALADELVGAGFWRAGDTPRGFRLAESADDQAGRLPPAVQALLGLYRLRSACEARGEGPAAWATKRGVRLAKLAEALPAVEADALASFVRASGWLGDGPTGAPSTAAEVLALARLPDRPGDPLPGARLALALEALIDGLVLGGVDPPHLAPSPVVRFLLGR